MTDSTLDASVLTRLSSTSTATITTILFKRGLRNVWMRRAKPLRAGSPTVAGPAFTMRFIPAREDLSNPAAWSSPRSTRVAVEEMPAGCVVVVDACGIVDAGILGDILCERMARRGVAGLVTDGAVRDVAGVASTGLAVWCNGVAAPPAAAQLIFAGWQEAVACGGVAIFPDDIIVADADGAVVIPRAMATDVAAQADEQDRLERWILAEVSRGAALPGLYPPDAASLARYKSSNNSDDSNSDKSS